MEVEIVKTYYYYVNNKYLKKIIYVKIMIYYSWFNTLSVIWKYANGSAWSKAWILLIILIILFYFVSYNNLIDYLSFKNEKLYYYY